MGLPMSPAGRRAVAWLRDRLGRVAGLVRRADRGARRPGRPRTRRRDAIPDRRPVARRGLAVADLRRLQGRPVADADGLEGGGLRAGRRRFRDRAAPRGRLPGRPGPARRHDRRRPVRHDLSRLHRLGGRDGPDAPRSRGRPPGPRRLAPRAAPAAVDRGAGLGPRRSGLRRLGLRDRAPVQARGGGRVGAPRRRRPLVDALRGRGACGSPASRPTTPRSARP